eukprot:6216322-Alexandrium_andersonii.AAC.1
MCSSGDCARAFSVRKNALARAPPMLTKRRDCKAGIIPSEALQMRSLNDRASSYSALPWGGASTPA